MKMSVFLSFMFAITCSLTSVSYANGSQPKAGIEKIGFSPGAINPLQVNFDNITICENHNLPVLPAQTPNACDKAYITTSNGKSAPSEVKGNYLGKLVAEHTPALNWNEIHWQICIDNWCNRPAGKLRRYSREILVPPNS